MIEAQFGLDSGELGRTRFEWLSAQNVDAAGGAASQAGGSHLRRVAGRVAREPFVHFVLLGAAMFFVSHHLEERSRFTRITITKEQVRGIADNYRLQYGVLPATRQLDALVDNFIREEIFYHEALKLGLDADDEIIRRRLVQKYEFLQQDLATPAEPTEFQLLDYYNQHLDQYRRPQTVTFTHV